MAEQFANAAQTTISGAITSGAGTLVVASATGFPALGTFRCLLSAEGANTNEIVSVTAVSGATFTISRAAEAYAGVTAASAHADGATITHIVSAAVMAAATAYGQPDDPGTVTLPTANFLVQWQRLTVSGTEQFTATGTASVYLADLGNAPIQTGAPVVYVGTPKAPALSFTVPTDYFLDQIARIALVNAQRATLVGTANLVLTDDFKTRSRITLAGNGF